MRPTPWKPRPIPTAFMDYETGRGVLSNGQPFTPKISPRRQKPTLADKLDTVANLRINGQEIKRILFTGKIPTAESNGRHWLLVQTPGWETYRGHWLGTPPTGRFDHTLTRARIDVKVAKEWFGDTPLTPQQARDAWDVCERMLGEFFRNDLEGASPMMMTPAATGHNLWALTLPKNYDPPLLEDDVAEQLHATSTQHHLDHLVAGESLPDHPDVVAMIDPNVSPKINSFSYVDGRFMYASLTRALGMAPGVRLNRAQCWELMEENPYVRARFFIRFTVPANWNHVGIFGVPFESASQGWYYPNRPGARGECWADASEIFVARKFGWAIDFVEGIVFNQKRYSTRKRFEKGSDVATRRVVDIAPLDTWSERLQKARQVAANYPDFPPVIRTAIGAALRAILIQSIGAFASRGRGKTGITYDPKMIPVEYQGSVVQKGKAFIYEIPQSLDNRMRAYYHPELAVQVWGRGRAKVLHHKANGFDCGALTLPGNSIIGINGDAIYSTELPRWALPVEHGGADDGKAGRIRVQGFIDSPVKTPESRAARDRLRDRAQKAGFDAANFSDEFLPIDDLGAHYAVSEEDE